MHVSEISRVRCGIVQHQTVHVDGCEAEILPKDPQPEVVVGVDVDLSDFAVPAARSERP